MPHPGNAAALEAQRRTAALLGACCLCLSTLEYLIPKPLPFMRLGLANLPLLLALDLLSPASFALLTLIKVLGQGLIAGTFFSYLFLFSLAGSSASALIMYLLRRGLGARRTGFAGLSVLGALASNSVQLLLARLFLFAGGIRFLIPPFLAAGLITGTALGIFTEVFTARSIWYQERRPVWDKERRSVQERPL